MSTFTFAPDLTAQLTLTPNVKQIKFSDGYEQRQAQGMNPTAEKWSLTFSNRDLSEAQDILDFFAAANAVDSFVWTPPDETDPIKVVCRSWQKSIPTNGVRTITATFEQVFDP